MLHFLKQLFLFRIGQKSARGVARMVGFGRLGSIVGLIGGIKAIRHGRHA